MTLGYDFCDGKQVGNHTKKKVIDYLSGLEKTMSVHDVSDDPNYQQGGASLIWQHKVSREKGGIERLVLNRSLIEVKWDVSMGESGNFLFETWSNYEQGKKGWLYTSEAKFLAYVSVKEDILYMMQFNGLRDWIEDNKNMFLEFTSPTGESNGDVIYRMKGVLVPRVNILRDKDSLIKTIHLD
ncbi:hypothetical protein HQ545_06830 [Candidatus Woesearchaeota archaeon]|nr:hypothetical protein [Candidatus Woesearchaeota archaeon]